MLKQNNQLFTKKEPDYNELLQVIYKQREYYANAFVKFSNLLRDAKHYDLAIAALRIATNYGIISNQEVEERTTMILALGDEDITDEIITFLGKEVISLSQLRLKFNYLSERAIRKSIDKLLTESRIIKASNTIGVSYKLAG